MSILSSWIKRARKKASKALARYGGVAAPLLAATGVGAPIAGAVAAASTVAKTQESAKVTQKPETLLYSPIVPQPSIPSQTKSLQAGVVTQSLRDDRFLFFGIAVLLVLAVFARR